MPKHYFYKTINGCQNRLKFFKVMFEEELTKDTLKVIEDYYDFLCSKDSFKYNKSYFKKTFESFKTKRNILKKKMAIYEKFAEIVSKKKLVDTNVTITIDLLFNIEIYNGAVTSNYISDSAFWGVVNKNFNIVIKGNNWNAAYEYEYSEERTVGIELAIYIKCIQIINLHK